VEVSTLGNLEEDGLISGIGEGGDVRDGGLVGGVLVGSGNRDRNIGGKCGFGVVLGG
jgi:hypothetical protein